MKLPTDKSPSALYEAWWKAVGERQMREVPSEPTRDTYEMRKIERSEFISLIKQLLLWVASQ